MTKFDPDNIPNWEPDALVSLTLLSTEEGGRSNPVLNGYHPTYRVMPEYWTSTRHFFVDCDTLEPGSSGEAYVKFLTPEAYPSTLTIGQVIEVGEGEKLIGRAIVKEIYNEMLRAV